MSAAGKLTADFIAIIKFGSQESQLPSTQPEALKKPRNKQDKLTTITRVPRRCVPDQRISFDGLVPGIEQNMKDWV